MQVIRDVIARHKMGERVGITSVCSAHPLVIEATLRHAAAHAAPFVLIEATSNQVNQDGGYTGMTPAAFRDFVAGHRRPRRLPARSRRARRRSSRPQCLDAPACRRGHGEGRGHGRRLRPRRLRQNPPRLLDELRRRSGAASRTHHRRARGEALPGRRRAHFRATPPRRRATSSAPRSRCRAALTRTSESLR